MKSWLRAATGTLALACAATTPAAPPEAPKPAAVEPAPPAPTSAFPETPRETVTDVYHGVRVSEDYRWLEDAESAEVKAWVERQNEFSSRYLAQLPQRESIAERVKQVLGFQAPSYFPIEYRAGRYFAGKHEPPLQQPRLVVLQDLFSAGGAKGEARAEASQQDRVLVDPTALDPSGRTSIDWFEPSPDGKLVAVSLSQRGTEAGDVHLYDVVSGAATGEVIPRVQGATAGGDLAWTPDGKGFYYTRYPAPGERPPEDSPFYQQLYFHRLGTPVAEDRYELGKELPRIAEIRVSAAPGSSHVLATVQKGDGGEFAMYVRDPKGRWQQISEFGDGLVQAAFGPRGDLYVLSQQGAPRGKILRVSLRNLDVAKAPVVVPQGDDAIVRDFWGESSMVASGDRLYVKYQAGGPSELRAFTLDGKPAAGPEPLPVSSYGAVQRLDRGRILFSNGSFTRPWGWYVFDPKSGATRETALSGRELVDMTRVEVSRELATSKDGTQVPVNVVQPPGVPRDGSAPCVVTGYGGYGVSISPRYGQQAAMLLEQSVVFAVANVRGGGEFGAEWHRAGSLTHKQNVFDDFASVIEHLVAAKHCASDRVVILGASNGGLLMGATLVQNPGLVRAVVSYVGLYDMLRVELSPNGSFNVTEFGTVKDRAQFDALYAYSPYHHVQGGTAYPATLLLTGANDPRVDPMQSRKMAARLQAATSGSAPILFRSDPDAGHGRDKKLDDRIAETTDVLAFVFSQLGVTYRSVAAPLADASKAAR